MKMMNMKKHEEETILFSRQSDRVDLTVFVPVCNANTRPLPCRMFRLKLPVTRLIWLFSLQVLLLHINCNPFGVLGFILPAHGIRKSPPRHHPHHGRHGFTNSCNHRTTRLFFSSERPTDDMKHTTSTVTSTTTTTTSSKTRGTSEDASRQVVFIEPGYEEESISDDLWEEIEGAQPPKWLVMKEVRW